MTRDTDKTFRWAILGTGPAARKFVRGVAATGGQAVTVASRDPANARRFAAETGIPHAAESWEEAVAVGADAVYVATPPSLHESHARLAIAAGRAVLIEKPLAQDAAGARRIADAAEAAGVFAMEALWTRFLPAVVAARARLDAGDLGTPLAFAATFAGASVPDPAAAAFDPDRGGGALLHRGVYAVSLARHFLGPVTEIAASGRIGATGVDEDAALLLTHASGAVSLLAASLVTRAESGAEIRGTTATLGFEGPIWRPFGLRLDRSAAAKGGGAGGKRFEALRESALLQRLSDRLAPLRARRRTTRIAAPFRGNGYGHEAEAVMAALGAGRIGSEVMPLSESVEVLEVIDTARARLAWAAEGAS